MRNTLFLLSVLAVVTGLFVCTPVSNPYDDANNAGISKNPLSLADTTKLKVAQAYPCSVLVTLPKYIAGYKVLQINPKGDTVVLDSGSSIPTSDPYITFSISPTDTGTLTIRVIATRTNQSSDILEVHFTTIKADNRPPTAVADSAAYHVDLNDSVVVKFKLHDPDGNLYMGTIGTDSADMDQHATLYNILTHIYDTNVTRTYKRDALLPGLTGNLVILCRAFDAEGLASAAAQCTIKVSDKEPPVIARIGADSLVAQLPFTIKAVVKDNWAVDSVKFNGSDMAKIADTFSVNTSTLDTGTTNDSIVAWDKAGNRASYVFHLIYHGVKTYPPAIKNLDKTVNEGHKFDTLFLDTCVTIADPTIANPVAYIHDSLTWQVTDSAGNSIVILAGHKLVVTHPIDPGFIFADSEWSGKFTITFRAIALSPGRPSSDPKQAIFTVTEIPDPPVIKKLTMNWCKNVDDTLPLDSCATDPDNLVSSIGWQFVSGAHLKVDTVYKVSCMGVPPLQRCIFLPTRRITLGLVNPADSLWYGTDSIVAIATDPTGKVATKKIGALRKNVICLVIITKQAEELIDPKR